ncbi:hypothetical protein, partial [Roseisolibacter sp. H3M3-2]|uniref:hypothetical protein n=1 Tax=Roseisolibacter sp. H3M3-2 TaxID=3031323 RepID=UPI0023DAFD5D
GDGDRAVALARVRAALGAGRTQMQGYAGLPGDAREFDYGETPPHADPLLEPLRASPDLARLLEPRG